jgi:hypothetical protein
MPAYGRKKTIYKIRIHTKFRIWVMALPGPQAGTRSSERNSFKTITLKK